MATSSSSVGPLATCLLSALQVREPRCIAPSAGYLRCRLSRCTNARPLTPRGDEAPASGCEARLACWVEGYPGTRRETRAATLGPDGEAVWEQELWLELHSWPPLLIVQLTLVAPADGAQPPPRLSRSGGASYDTPSTALLSSGGAAARSR